MSEQDLKTKVKKITDKSTFSIGIGKFRVANLDKSKVKFKALHEYLHDAKRQIIYYCSRRYPGYTNKIVNNEDMVSLIAYSNMLADWRYVESNATQTSRNSFVNGYAFGFIKTVVKQIKKNSRNTMDIDISELYDIYDKKHELRQKKQDNYEILDKYLSKIPPKYSEMVTSYYYNNKTYKQIGEDFNITKQRVEQIISSSITKMKELAQNEKICRIDN